MWPLRELAPLLDPTLNDTVPLPVPEPEVTVIQLESLDALQAQPA